jgi:hypothetical protein
MFASTLSAQRASRRASRRLSPPASGCENGTQQSMAPGRIPSCLCEVGRGAQRSAVSRAETDGVRLDPRRQLPEKRGRGPDSVRRPSLAGTRSVAGARRSETRLGLLRHLPPSCVAFGALQPSTLRRGLAEIGLRGARSARSAERVAVLAPRPVSRLIRPSWSVAGAAEQRHGIRSGVRLHPAAKCRRGSWRLRSPRRRRGFPKQSCERSDQTFTAGEARAVRSLTE